MALGADVWVLVGVVIGLDVGDLDLVVLLVIERLHRVFERDLARASRIRLRHWLLGEN